MQHSRFIAPRTTPVSSEDVPLPPMSPIMDLIPDIPLELIDIAVANMSLNNSDAINPFGFSFSGTEDPHLSRPVRIEDHSRGSR